MRPSRSLGVVNFGPSAYKPRRSYSWWGPSSLSAMLAKIGGHVIASKHSDSAPKLRLERGANLPLCPFSRAITLPVSSERASGSYLEERLSGGTVENATDF